jgi:hypothetical protein
MVLRVEWFLHYKARQKRRRKLARRALCSWIEDHSVPRETLRREGHGGPGVGPREVDGGLSNASECYALNSHKAIRYLGWISGAVYRPYTTRIKTFPLCLLEHYILRIQKTGFVVPVMRMTQDSVEERQAAAERLPRNFIEERRGDLLEAKEELESWLMTPKA